MFDHIRSWLGRAELNDLKTKQEREHADGRTDTSLSSLLTRHFFTKVLLVYTGKKLFHLEIFVDTSRPDTIRKAFPRIKTLPA